MKRKMSIFLLAAFLLLCSDISVSAEETQSSELQNTTVESTLVQKTTVEETTIVDEATTEQQSENLEAVQEAGESGTTADGNVDPSMIFGNDDRVPVNNSMVSPYKQVVAIFVSHKGRRWWNGSGVLIAPNKVLTAAHVIKNVVTNESYEEVIVSPGNDGIYAPYGQISGSIYHFFTAYKNDTTNVYSQNKFQEDLAVVTLDSSFPSSVGYHSVVNSVSIGQAIDVVGFPQDKNLYMYSSPGSVSGIENNIIKYRNDTLPGNSGGPVFDKQGKIVAINIAEPRVDSVYTYSYWQEHGNNFGRRINSEAVNLINTALSDSKPPTGVSKSIPTYRLYHSGLKYHLYTNDKNEKNILSNKGWNYEGVSWRTDSSGTSVHRLYHPGIQKHLYTVSTNEKDTLVKSGWKYEGVTFYSSGVRNVYRLYHAGLKVHLYTTDLNEKNHLSVNGWKYEGVSWNVE